MAEARRVGRWWLGTIYRNPAGDIDHDPVALGHDWRYDAEAGRTDILRSVLALFRVTAKTSGFGSMGLRRGTRCNAAPAGSTAIRTGEMPRPP